MNFYIKNLITLFILFSNLTATAQTFKFEVPFLEDVKKSLLLDLIHLMSIEGSNASPLHKQFIGPIASGSNYIAYLNSRISLFNFRDDFLGTFLMVGDGSKTKIVSVTSDYQYLLNEISPLARISILIHEAEHNRESNSDHVYCPDVLLNEDGTPNISPLSNSSPAGAYACDKDETGSYGVQIVFLNNIAKNCSNCSAKDKADAANVARLLLPRIISEPAKLKLKIDAN